MLNLDKLISDVQIKGKQLYLRRQELQATAQKIQQEMIEVERAMLELDGREKAYLEIKAELDNNAKLDKVAQDFSERAHKNVHRETNVELKQ